MSLLVSRPPMEAVVMASMSFSGARTLVTASVSRWGGRGRNSRQPWMELSSFTVRRVWISSWRPPISDSLPDERNAWLWL